MADQGGQEMTDPSTVDTPDYHTINHTAVQTCGWTNNALSGEGQCYKYAFYGIESHRCVQMTPVVTCNERCIFCWRDHSGHEYELEGVEWDDPEAVVEASIDLQKKLLSGHGGKDEITRETFEEAMDPKHVAISLDGEPTLYPYLPELIEAFHDHGLTTFLVSNGTRPDVLATCEPTQLYLSLDAPDPETFQEVVVPTIDNAWAHLNESLSVLADHTSRTTVRITAIAGENMFDPAGYTELIELADPDFVEIKAYMHVGSSRDRLNREAMPDHEDIVAFAEAIQDHLPEHDVLKTATRSRVAMLAKDEDTWVPTLAE